MKEEWDTLSRYYFGLGLNLMSIEMSMLSMLKVERFSKIVEVGCGPGFLIPLLISRKKEGA